MLLALYIFLALVVVGTVLYLLDRRGITTQAYPGDAKASSPAGADEPQADDACCGMHITCEKDSLLAAVSDEIVYYDDEELDDYRGRQPEEYCEAEIEQFRDVLLTLLPTDIAGWGRSLQLRGIALPSAVRDELLMIVSEARQGRVVSSE